MAPVAGGKKKKASKSGAAAAASGAAAAAVPKKKRRSGAGPPPSKLARSHQRVVAVVKQNKVAAGRAWKTAATCPVYQRKIHKPAANATATRPATKARTYMRANRILSNHAIKVLFSGAGAQAAERYEREGLELRTIKAPGPTSGAEFLGYPVLPAPPASVVYGIEGRVAAFAQSVLTRALAVKRRLAGPGEKGEQKAAKQRLSPKIINLAAAAVAAHVRRHAAAGAAVVVPAPIKKRRLKAKAALAAKPVARSATI